MGTASFDGTIIVWSTEHSTIAQQWLVHRGPARPLHSLQMVDDLHPPAIPRTRKSRCGTSADSVAALEGPADYITAYAWSPDGTLITSASKDQTICVRDAQTFQLRDEGPACQGAYASSFGPYCLLFSPDARYLAWIPADQYPYCCVVWRPLTNEQPRKLYSSPYAPQPVETIIKTFSFDPESKRIATTHGWTDYDSSENADYPSNPDARHLKHNFVRVWDIAVSTVHAVLPGRGADIRGVSFSADGRSVLSAACDGSANVWSAKSWKQTASLKGEAGCKMSTVCFSPDGVYVATDQVRLQRADGEAYVVEFADYWPDVSKIPMRWYTSVVCRVSRP